MKADSISGTSGNQPMIEMPAPTAWPIVLALGIALLFAGLLTSASVSVLGAVLALTGTVGWFRDVLPHEKHEAVAVVEGVAAVSTRRQRVARVAWANQELSRARLPLAIYPVSAGVKGGLVGGAVMAILAVAYGIVSGHGIWYPINLLSAGFFVGRDTTAQLVQFHWDFFALAVFLHLFVSFLVGLLYGATLPMFPRHPVLLGGLVAPLLWSGLLHSTLDLINPVLNSHIDWLWFAVSQVGFGIAAGIVVSMQEKIHTWQYLPFAVRAGMESADHSDQGNNNGGNGAV